MIYQLSILYLEATGVARGLKVGAGAVALLQLQHSVSLQSTWTDSQVLQFPLLYLYRF